MKKFLASLWAVLLIFGLSATVQASIGNFNVNVLPDGVISVDPPNEGNDGVEHPVTGEVWIEYPQPDGASWWNQWWYDDPPVAGGKWIDLDFWYEPYIWEQDSSLEITINWSTFNYPEQGPDGLPPIPGITPGDAEVYIERLTDYFPGTWIIESLAGDDPALREGLFDSGQIWLPIDYNPEWVSIDVRGYNMEIIGGTLEHVCAPVPIPGAVWLLGTGLFGIVGLRRKLKS